VLARKISDPKAPKAEKLILDAVIKNPKLSVYGLQKRLEIAGLKLSVHGIYNVLVRYNLQRRQLRERFSVEHPVKTVFATALAPAHRAKIIEENIKEGKAIYETISKESRTCFKSSDNSASKRILAPVVGWEKEREKACRKSRGQNFKSSFKRLGDR